MKNRAELSLHTNMCSKLGICDVKEYINEAAVENMTAIAISDTASVQSFPSAFYEGIKCGIKIIYGVELFYKKGEDIFPFTLLAKNKDGVKEIYRILSNSYMNNFVLVPLALLNEIDRKNVLLGISLRSEPFYKIMDGCTNEELKEILSFFDYVMIPPIEILKYECFGLFKLHDIELKMIIERVIDICDEIGVLPVASDEAICVYTDDMDCERILLMQKGLASYKISPLAYFRNTEEMLLEFSFLKKEKAEEIVVENSNRIADIIEDTFTPFDNDLEYPDYFKNLKGLTYASAYKNYGNELPMFVRERIETELESISKSNRLILQYVIYASIAEKSAMKGFSTFSYGNTGSSFVAFLLGFTNVNPLPPHYHCIKCHFTELYENAYCGEDLTHKKCPNCKSILIGDGYNIPAETLFGIDGKKSKDIILEADLNLSIQEIKAEIKKVYPCTIIHSGMVQCMSYSKAVELFREYCRKDKYKYSEAYETKICKKLSEKRIKTSIDTSKVFIIPNDKEIFDFTPIQYSENNPDAPIITHLDFSGLSDILLSINTRNNKYLHLLNLLEKSTGISSQDISFDDNETLETIKKGRTAGIPDFSSDFSKEIISRFNFDAFSDLIKILGFCHGKYDLGTKRIMWSDIIATQEDIYSVLRNYGVDKHTAFSVFEKVKTGNKTTTDQDNIMYENGVPDDFIEVINGIDCIYPKAQCVERIKLNCKLAYYKTYFPLEFYCEYLNSNIKEYNEIIANSGATDIYDMVNTYKKRHRDVPEILNVYMEIMESEYEIISEKPYNSIEKVVIDNGKIKFVLKSL